MFPDLNLIEWILLNWTLEERRPSNKAVIQVKNVPVNNFVNLAKSRLEEVTENKGAHIKYWFSNIFNLTNFKYFSDGYT